MTREEKEQWDIFMKIWVIPALKNTWNEKKCKEIVEALEEWEEQEPCEDAISREDALMCLTGEIKETDTIETIIARSGRRIRKLPSVKPQEPKTGYWIPVSERLPERSGEYLVSVIDGSGEDNDYKAVRVAWFAHKKNYRITESEWRELGIDETVIAWMPLPAPYKPQESKKVNCKSTKCENCQNHNYCDYEPQESEDKE